MSTTIEDRAILLLKDEAGLQEPQEDADTPKIGGHGFWERLGERTGIASKRWRQVYARKQRVTSDMLEALARLFPSYAFWLATGITDATNGHTAPNTAQAFPERTNIKSMSAEEYFKRSLELAEKLFDEAQVNVSDDKERMYAAERTRPLAHWWDSPLCDAAYRIASSEEYEYLKGLWDDREDERKRHIERITKQAKRQSVTAENDKSSKIRSTPFLGVDPRTKHQDHWDLFYEPKNLEKTKFALSVLNVPPAKLTDEQLDMIANMSLTEVEKYLVHHRMDSDFVFPFKGGVIRYADKGLLQEEVERLTTMVLKQRAKNDDKAS